MISRRTFLLAGLGVIGVLLARRWLGGASPASIPGSILGASSKVGHRLRAGEFPAPSEERHAGIVIVGGGMAGLSAGWRLNKAGYQDYVLLELEPEVGGNSRHGENETTPYPWGAHYVPVPGPDAHLVHELFEELGIIEGRDREGLPIYNELFLCSDPQDRLLINGRWQEGLIPELGISEADKRQYKSFFETMEAFKVARGSDGRAAFSIPVDLSSRDPKFTALDQKTMAQYMDEHGWTSEPLRWYVDYCCRDDYGCRVGDVSAWAGIHYFASRIGKGANSGEAVLTWPEGNGWIVKQLARQIAPRVRPNALVFNVETAASGDVLIDYYDTGTHTTTRIVAKAAIFAAPRFVAARVVKSLRAAPPSYLTAFDYAPWMVANVSLDTKPAGSGAPLAWDNVSYHSPSLGYIVATHQRVERYAQPSTVISYYMPLCDRDPVEARKTALSRSYREWSDLIVADLTRIHPGIEATITHLDVWLWGHAMIRPIPGFIWGPDRQEAMTPHGRVFFAHSDMSGMSIFEEAQYRGVLAADQALGSIQATPQRI